MTPAGPNAHRGAPDVVVVGGGIVGCATAAFLAEAGLRVVVVERGGLASGASGANSGVVQHPYEAELAPLYEETLRLYATLSQQDAGFTLPAEPAGLLFASPDLAAVERHAASIAAAFPAEYPEILSGPALRALEPGLATDLAACRVTMGYPVPPAASTYAYATIAERNGAIIRTGSPASLDRAGDRIVGVRLNGSRRLAAGLVIVAAGPWTPELVDPAAAWLPIRRTWGVVVEAELASPPRHVIEEAGIDAVLTGEDGDPAELESAGAGAPHVAGEFSLCTAAGISAVGSTFLRAQPDPAAWVEPLLARGARFVPGIAGAPIRGARACARPRSRDGRPLVGALPGMPGLLVCAGHGPWGISTGPATARLVADLALGRAVTIPASLDAARFGSPVAVGVA